MGEEWRESWRKELGSGLCSRKNRLRGILVPSKWALCRELPPLMGHRFPEDFFPVLKYSNRVPFQAHWLEYLNQLPLRAYWWSRTTLNDRVPGYPLLSLKSLGQVSLRAYWLVKLKYRVSHRTRWPSEGLLSRLRSRGRSLSDRRFREDSLVGPQQQTMVRHPSSKS